MTLNVTMETTDGYENQETSFTVQDNITIDNGTSVSHNTSQAEFWCSHTIPIPYTDPCSGFIVQTSSVVGAIICVAGLHLNGLSLLAFKQMSVNADFLFLAKCLAVYDSIFLFAYLNAESVICLTWMFGFGFIHNLAYEHWYRFMYVLFRIAGPMSFWTVCVITVQR